MAYKFDLSKGEEALLKVAAFSTAILAIVGILNFYKSDLWKPKVQFISVDYDNAFAELLINGKKKIIKGESPYSISYLGNTNWAIKFGASNIGSGIRINDRIELLNNNSVEEIIAVS